MCQHNPGYKKVFNQFKSTMVTTEDKEIHTASRYNLKQRRKIWELEHNYHCAVIGTCLTLLETRKLVSHFVQNTTNMSDYDFHTHAVHMISQNSKPGKKIQNVLDSKFKKTINEFKKMDQEQLCQRWQKVLKSGDVISTFWALITHPKAEPEIIKNAYGDIHMMSHLSGAGNRADLKQLKHLQSERIELRETCVQWQSRFQQELVENERLRNELEQQCSKTELVSRELERTQVTNKKLLKHNSEQSRQELLQQVEKLKQQLNHQTLANEKLNQQMSALNQEFEKVKNISTLNALEVPLPNTASALLAQGNSIDDDCSDCPFNDEDDKEGLCGRCILYVGGRTRLTPHFKKLVENKEGTFLHHDGGLEQSAQELNSLLNKADLVVFPMDCVSHKAYFQLKKVCKKQQKPYRTLNSSGVSSFSSMLDNLSSL